MALGGYIPLGIPMIKKLSKAAVVSLVFSNDTHHLPKNIHIAVKAATGNSDLQVE